MKIVIVALAACAVFAAPASAQQAGGVDDAPYSLEQALRDAVQRDPRIRAAGSRVQEAGEEFAEARSLRFPTINVTGGGGWGYNRNEARSIGIYEGNSRTSGLEVKQTIYSFGRIGAREREASALIAAAEYDADDTRQSVLADAAIAYAEQVHRRSILNRRIEFERLVGEQETSVRELLELGRSDLTQMHEVLRYLHQARAQRIEAETAYNRAQSELARLTGDIRENLDAEGLVELERRQPETLAAARTRGMEGAPIAGKARQNLVVADSRMKYQRAELWPSLELKLGGGDGYVGEIKTRDADVQLVLSMPLFEGGRKFAALRKARYAREAAQYDLDADMEQLELNISVSWNLVNGLARACLELERSLEDAAEIVSIVEEKLRAGRGTVLDQLEAEEIVAETDVTLLEKRIELAEARVGLLRNIGSLSPAL
ncbi:MAG: TolC family protein [Gammaproteobacteria bacterium]|nr:TolC family protein [Gammaproteobacteria bacterium]MDE0414634.1 TolC family protein [Gammaproteobacteria bacterium]